jgi:translocation and assembly module TamB
MSTTQALPPKRRRWRRTLIGTGVLVLVFALLGGLVGALFWAAGTSTGTAWLLARLSASGIGVQVIEPQGMLLGDLQAKQVIITQGGTRIVIDRPAWRALSVRYTPVPDLWALVHMQALAAERVTITVTPQADSKPFTLPMRLRLPLELDIDELRVDEVRVPGLEERPLRDVRTKLQLGNDHGRQHRLDGLSLRMDPLQISGHLRIGAEAPMALDVQLQATQSTQAGATGPALPSWAKTLRADWQAQLQASGPLARFNAQARLRAQGQSLDATAQVAPTERWPLPQLDARTQGLDLSALLEKAPLTALTGTLRITPAGKDAPNTLVASADFSNAKPGRWDVQQLPLRQLALGARWRTDQVDQLELTRIDAQLADERADAGTVQGTASWKAGEFAVDAEFSKVQPSSLDSHLAAMTLSGPIKLSGKTQPRKPSGETGPPSFTALAELSGQLAELARPVRLRLDAVGSAERIELRELRAAAGGAQALLSGAADRSADVWQLKAKAALVDFDPRPWFPAGPPGGWQGGVHHLNLNGNTSLIVPDSVRPTGPTDKRSVIERLGGLRGEATAKLNNSVVAGVPISGDVTWRHANTRDPMRTEASLDLAGNRIRLDGQIAPDASGSKDHWALEARAPALARLAPLLRLAMPAGQATAMVDNLSGTLNADAQASGRWPEISTQGKASLSGARAGSWSVGQGEASWQVGSTVDAPLELKIDIGQAAWTNKQLGSTTLQLKGSARDHQFNLRTELKVAPPVWVESVQGRPPEPGASAPAAGASAPSGTAVSPQPPEAPPVRTLALAAAHGSFSGNLFAATTNTQGSTAPWAWKGVLQQLEVRTTESGATPLLTTKDIGLELTGGDTLHAMVTAGRADILGAGLRWNRIDWETGRGVQTQQLDMQADLEPLAVAPLLRRIQPNFGWGGDLQIAGKVLIRQTDSFSADIVLERTQGDLTVTEESGTQALGLTDLRVGLDAKDGIWNFSAGMAGQQLGVLGGALVVRTSPQLAWPAADAPVQGVLEAQVAHLGTWGAWVPAGWRLDGKLNISASLGGRLNAREYTGSVKGSGIGVRNMVEGVNVTDGEVDISLRGDTATINKFSARGGSGTMRLEGDAKLDDTWRARLKLVADKFQLLGRVDLRIVTSGEAQVSIDGETVKTEGRFTVDEGLVDFTRLTSPGLGDDVVVTGRGNDPREAPPAAPAANGNNRFSLDVLVNLGQRLQMRGLGIDTLLRGELRVARPGGKWALVGTVNAVEGTFANYGQKLVIDRGVISFNGAPSNMRLDIEATRPNLDVRVGVAVTGPLQNLRVRLFSEPEMSNNEKLSWLMLGRASDGLGKSDTALVQRAAFALLAGEGDGGPGAITKAFGIDDVGLRQTDGDTRETVVSVGKQVSKRVYIAYEQNLATSSGSFQVTYRIAQRFVMRLQSGLDRSVDLIGTWRWE